VGEAGQKGIAQTLRIGFILRIGRLVAWRVSLVGIQTKAGYKSRGEFIIPFV